MKGSDAGKAQAATTVYLCLNALHSLAIMLHPFTPASCEKISKFLACKGATEEGWKTAAEMAVAPGAKLNLENLAPVFTKIEDSQVQALREKLEARTKK